MNNLYLIDPKKKKVLKFKKKNTFYKRNSFF